MIYGNQFLNQEIIKEDTIYKDRKNGFAIAVSPDTGRNYIDDPYIKVYNNTDYTKADKTLRISIKTGDIVIHDKHNGGKKSWTPNNKELKELAKDLQDTVKDGKFKGMKTIDAIYKSIEGYFPDKDIKKFDIPNKLSVK